MGDEYGEKVYSNMFSEIAVFKQVAVVEDFVRMGTPDVLERNKKVWQERIAQLGIGVEPIEYDAYCDSDSNSDFTRFTYRTFAEAKYKDPELGIGFMISYFPVPAKRDHLYDTTLFEP